MPAHGIDVTELRPGEVRSAARVLAAAFLDDPIWTAIGPRSRSHRAYSNRVAFWGIVRGSASHGARIRVARDATTGRIGGLTIAFANGQWPLPDRSFAWELPWVVAAGPLPVFRGMRDDQMLRKTHVAHPHNYLWFIGVAPEFQGRGYGRALMADLHEWSDPTGLGVFLETGTRDNVAFYASVGYREGRELPLPSGVPMWQMERPGTDAAVAA
jgi:GNAT superfamily N-acetyltransferase